MRLRCGSISFCPIFASFTRNAGGVERLFLGGSTSSPNQACEASGELISPRRECLFMAGSGSSHGRYPSDLVG